MKIWTINKDISNINWESIVLNLKSSGIKILNALILIFIVLIISKIILFIISKGTKKVIDKKTKDNDINSKQIITTMTVVRSICRYVIYAVGLFVVLDFLGLDSSVNNILVTAGIGGLIISLGAQSFIKDIISGFFILFERQFAVGDLVEIAGKDGIVKAISLRSTYLDHRGQKIIIPNGQISTVVNYNNKYNSFRFVVPTAYEANTKEMIEKIKAILKEFYQIYKDDLIEEPEVLGVSDFNTSSVDILVSAKCKTMKHYELERKMRLLIKERFDEERIEIPYQKIVIKKEN